MQQNATIYQYLSIVELGLLSRSTEVELYQYE